MKYFDAAKCRILFKNAEDDFGKIICIGRSADLIEDYIQLATLFPIFHDGLDKIMTEFRV